MFEVTDADNRINGAKIKVVGVGGGGCNAVNTMIRSGLSGIEYIVANTDAQALSVSLASTKIQLGGTVTKGLGAGANPEVGKKAALEDYEKVSEVLKGADMVFITAGMGGGTGTGAAPVIAKLAKELGALTVGVVTKPFVFEGKKRFKQAEEGIRNLEDCVDSLITIPNQRLLYLAGENLSLVDTFRKADEVLLNAVRGISDLINNTGHINADFADVSTIMANKGLALMGTGSGSGPGRAIKAATDAISSPLLEDISINGATGIIINITGNETLSMHETNEAVTLIMEATDENAEIIFGTVIDNSVGDEIKITVIATGLGGRINAQASNGINIQNAISSASTSVSTSNSMQMKSRIEESTRINTMQEVVAPASSSVSTPMHAAPVSTPSTAAAHENSSMQTAQHQSMPVEEKTDFDRFMNDKNIFAGNFSQNKIHESGPAMSEETQTVATTSKLIQSIRDAANRYDAAPRSQAVQTQTSESQVTSTSARAKSIAEKLGFINFDEDEFDTPSYLRKEDKQHSGQTSNAPSTERKRDIKNFEI